MMEAVADLASGVGRWRTSLALGLQDITLRYKRSLLGPFWLSASLIATVLALALVFSTVFQQDFVAYATFVGAGLLAWQMIAALVGESCGSVMEHGAYLQNVRIPLSVVAGRLLFRNAIIFAHNFLAITALLLVFGAQLSANLLLALPGALTILAFGYFLSMALGPICTRFRDIPQVIASVMQILFFVTPIFWMPDAVSHRPVFTHANPFFHMVELVRAPLLGNLPTALNWQVSLWCVAAAAGLAIVTVSLTRKRLNLWL